MVSFLELFDRLDPNVNVRGKQFERIVKWWLLHDPIYRTQIKRVWLCRAGLLLALSVPTAVTGARTPVIWFKICPMLLTTSAVLLVTASLI